MRSWFNKHGNAPFVEILGRISRICRNPSGLSAVGDSKKWLSNFTESSSICRMYRPIKGVQQFKIFYLLDYFPCLKIKERNYISVSWPLNMHLGRKKVCNFEFHNPHLPVITWDRYETQRTTLKGSKFTSGVRKGIYFPMLIFPGVAADYFVGKECQYIP